MHNRLFRPASGLLTVLALAAMASPALAQLSLVKAKDQLVVTSSAPPTWKMVIAVAKQSSQATPGGGVVQALYIPAKAKESLVVAEARSVCCADFGLDNVEWRYLPKDAKTGIRAPASTKGTLDSVEITKKTAKQIVITMKGQWPETTGYTRTLTIDPTGYGARTEVTWNGPTEHWSMWWIMTLFRRSWVDAEKATIQDADTAPVSLPIARGKPFPLPEGIGFPYVMTFPLKQGSLSSIRLEVATLGDTEPHALRYELGGDEKQDRPDVWILYPRWSKKGFEKGKTYVFDYKWRFDPKR
jgi:hypothetical protein